MSTIDLLAVGLLVIGFGCLACVIIASRRKQGYVKAHKRDKPSQSAAAAQVDQIIQGKVKGPIDLKVVDGHREPEPDPLDLAVADHLGRRLSDGQDIS